tara:strand:- start:211 stop:489 length:279 start_codon:yes stop_codon:yes gene_type:complete
MSKIKNEIDQRLRYSIDHANNIFLCLKQIEITEKTNEEFNKSNFLSSLIYKIYYLPINVLVFLKRVKIYREYQWTLKEIEILKKELDYLNKN